MAKFTDREIMERCVALSRKCVNEKAGKSNDIPPHVAAIVVRDGEIIGEAFRGELAPGDHAEFTLLEKKLAGIDVEGATLFTTLEPCVSRSPGKTPCAKWIIGRKIGKVIIGNIDRNPVIKGDGLCQLEDAGIKISLFDSDLMGEIKGINSGFFNQFRHRTKAELQDPVPIGEVGINGFPIGYDEHGNKVEFIEEDGEKWELILRRNDNDIANELNEITERVWYVRKLIMFENMANGREERKDEHEPFIQKALEKMKEMEAEYGGRENLVYDDFDWGFIQGKMSALRWVFGDDWESSLDT